jgi:DNA polymerase bacteriophage-type
VHILWRDIETKSTLDLRDVGAWKYATCTSTDVWCCAYAVDDGPIQLWVPGNPVPPEWTEAAHNPDWFVCAFNDQFERLIEQHMLGPRYGWPTIPIERHRCLQAAALSLALPASLKGAALALKLKQQKDESGRLNMMRMAKPRKPRKDEDSASVYWFDDADRLEKLYAYCKQDVATERELYRCIGQLSGEEQAIWLLDATINDRGIYIDDKLLNAAISMAKAARRELNAELQTITEGALETVNQPKLKDWLAAHGCIVTDIQKTTLKRALTRTSLTAAARRVIELRLDGAHAAAAKLLTMRAWRNGDGRARGVYRYHGAATGRWTSFGIQLQNLKRPLVEDLGTAIEAVASGDLARLRQHYPQPMSVVGDITRALICAQDGHRLIAADFSGIESRVTAWVSGQQSKIDQWAKFDRTQNPEDEPYFITGHRTFGFTREQARAPGKTGDLAFGYMGGSGAWKKLAPSDDTSSEAEIKQRQQAWRNAHPQTVRFWGDLNRAAIKAVQNPGKIIACKRIAFRRDDSFLRMRLPSGRKIAYPFPRLKTTDRGDLAVVFMDNQQGNWAECRHGLGAYGGTWIENAVQAVARDLFAAAMQRLEAAGYRITLHVHDEIVAEVPDDFGSAEEFLRILTESPPWADGLPIAAKVREGQRFCKITKPEPTTTDDAETLIEDEPENTTQAEPSQPQVGISGVAEIPSEPDECSSDLPKGSDSDHNLENDDDEREHAEEADPDSDPDEQLEADKPADEADQDRGDNYASGEQQRGKTSASYIYRDERGSPYLKVLRTSAKQFPQFHWENGRWIKGKPTGPKIPYRLPELLAAAPETPIFITEGEKDADNVAALGLIATTNSEGAGKGKWTTTSTRGSQVSGQPTSLKITMTTVAGTPARLPAHCRTSSPSCASSRFPSFRRRVLSAIGLRLVAPRRSCSSAPGQPRARSPTAMSWCAPATSSRAQWIGSGTATSCAAHKNCSPASPAVASHKSTARSWPTPPPEACGRTAVMAFQPATSSCSPPKTASTRPSCRG